MKATFGVALILMMAVSKFAIAQDEEQSQNTAESTAENTRPIEQIDVVTQRSLLSMRVQIRDAENALYSLFNDLNSVEKYQIRCRNVKRLGTYFSSRSCEPKFLKDFRQGMGRDVMMELRNAYGPSGMDIYGVKRAIERLEPDSAIRQMLSQDYEAMKQEMLRIAMENSDYRNLLSRIGELKGRYESAWEKRFGRKKGS